MKSYAFVVQQLTLREMRRKYARSRLGIVWSVLGPLLSMVVLSLIFSQLFRRSIDNYPIYYLSGFLLWQMFAGASSAALTALVDNKMLLLRIKFPMDVFIVTRVYTAFINLLYSFLAYALMLFVFQVPPAWPILLTPLVVACLLLFTLGFSYLLAAAYVFFGDVKHLYAVFLTLWMYLSAIFYPAEQLHGFIRYVIAVNPMFAYIHALRQLVMYAQVPHPLLWLQMALAGAGLYALGRWVFYRKKNAIMAKI